MIHTLRLPKLLGVLLIGGGLFLFASLVSYNSGDPSLNRATAEAVHNMGGTAGAVLADLLLQVLGVASLLAVALLLAWGWRLLRGETLTWLPVRLSGFFAGLFACALFLAHISAPSSWPIASGLGGAMGAMGKAALTPLLPQWLQAALAFALMVPLTLLALALNRDEWRSLYTLIEIPLHYIRQSLRLAWGAFSGEIGPGWRFAFQGAGEVQTVETAKVKAAARQQAGGKPTEKLVTLRDNGAISRRKAPEPKKQASLELRARQGDYELPELALLKDPTTRKSKRELSDSALKQNAKMLSTVLQDFGVKGEIVNIRPGPVVTLYELEPAAGTKSSRVIGLSDDISRSMSAISARIAVIQGKNAIGIELPNRSRETVYLRDLLQDEAYSATELSLPLALGKDIGGDPVVVDLARMPHLLVAGTTGSGKSVAINTMILSLVYQLTPEQCKFIMIDPKMLELSVYDGIPHLLTPVVTEPGKAVVALKWTVREMENRYRLMSTLGVRNVDSYNKRIKEARRTGEVLTREVQTGFDIETGKPTYETQEIDTTPLPFIVVIVDEMADLMLVAGKDIESSIQRLAQMARAAGIHIIMATQRPSVDVITGVIKANFPTRISFQVTSRIDSRTILGEQGAEQLLGQGDMLYMAGGGRITRVHGPFVSDQEVEEVVAHLKSQGEPTYIESVTQDEGGDELGFDEDESDEDRELYDRAVAIVARDRKASTSYVQRCLKIGYNRAARLIEKMERDGIVGPANHVGKREVLVREED